MSDNILKSKILNYYENKEDKIFASVIIDKANKFYRENHIIYTNFLNIRERNIATCILNKLNIDYYIFSPLENTERVVIFLIPQYLKDDDICDIINKYISVIKIIPKTKGVLTHREYMGTIYSIGIKEDMIGDIFVYNDNCYVFCFKKNEQYILNNITRVGRVDVSITVLSFYADEVKNIKPQFKSFDVIISSLRVDVVLSSIFALSRNEIKGKIKNGDLFVNSKEMYFVAYEVKENDILSFRKCGKVKIGNILRNTKSGKVVLKIYKYC